MPFDSFSEAMSSPAETSDKIAFAAGYVSTWLVAVAIVWGIPYYGYKKVTARKRVDEVPDNVAALLESRVEITSEDEESFDFDVSWLPDEFQKLLNAKRREHLELWREYGIGGCVEKQAHFTQIVLSTDVMMPGDPDATLERLKPYYWLIGMPGEADLHLRVPFDAPLWETDENRDEWNDDCSYANRWSDDYVRVLNAYGLSDIWKFLPR